MAFVYDLAEAKIRYFDFTVVEYYVLRLQIVMYDLLLALVEVFEAAEDLRNYQLGFFLRYLPILLQVEVEIRP